MTIKQRPLNKIILIILFASFIFADDIQFSHMTMSGDNAEITKSPNNSIASDSMSADTSSYRIEPGDVLQIDVLGEEELSQSLIVWYNGNISFPLIGEVKVIGLTTEQAAGLITEKLKKYYIFPVVSVILKSPTLAYVSVYGEVLRPGTFDYQRGFRITDYIALAGGPKGSANLRKVRVVRFQTEKPVATTINLDNIIKKGLTEENFELKSGDWLYVSKKFTIEWGFVLQLTTIALTSLNLYLTIQRL